MIYRLSKSVSITLIIALVLGLLPNNLVTYKAQASASPPTGFTTISSAAELQAIGATPTSRSGAYRLANDIDVSHINWNSIGDFSAPFMGTLDGNSKTISGLWSSGRGSNQGLFARIDGIEQLTTHMTSCSGYLGNSNRKRKYNDYCINT